jgi:hypothetical protein
MKILSGFRRRRLRPVVTLNKSWVANMLPLESEEFSLISDGRNRLDASVAYGIECPIRI